MKHNYVNFYKFIGVILIVLTRCSMVFSMDDQKETARKASFDQYKYYFSLPQIVKPLVESVTGLRISRLPEVKLVLPAELENVLFDETNQQLAIQMTTATREQIERLSRLKSKKMSQTIFAKYGIYTKYLYIVPYNISTITAISSNVKTQQIIEKMVIAHELLHALQDQQVNLAAIIRKADNREKLMTVNAILEGHAVFVQEKVGDIIEADIPVQEISRKLVLGSGISYDTALQMVGRTNDQLLTDTYLGGRDFIKWHEERAGASYVWHIIKTPPASTSIIFHPERYEKESAFRTNYSLSLDGIEFCSAHGRFEEKYSAELGEMSLRSLFANCRDKRDDIINCIEYAGIRTYANTDSAFTLYAFVCSNKEKAVEATNIIEVGTKKNIDELTKSKVIDISNIWEGNVEILNADYAHEIRYTSSTREICSTRILFGRILLDIVGGGLTNDEFTDIIRVIRINNKNLVDFKK